MSTAAVEEDFWQNPALRDASGHEGASLPPGKVKSHISEPGRQNHL